MSISSVIVLAVSGIGAGVPLLALQTASASPGATLYVRTDGSDTNCDGSVDAPDTGTPASACAFSTIQAAVDAATAGSTVSVAAGTYNQAVLINKSLTITGTGSGSTTISAPASLPAEGAVVDISGAGVSADISGLTVAGPGPSACGSIMSGVFVENDAYADVHDMAVNDIRDSSLSGCQNGRAILVGWGHGSTIPDTTGSATVSNVSISGYQKAGVEVSGSGSSATIAGNSITGVGPTSLIAANGVEVTFGAAANVYGNTITGNDYTPTSDYAAGILLYQPDSSTVVGANNVSSNEFGLWTDNQASLSAIDISGITGNTRNAVADTTGWSAPGSTYADAALAGTTDSDGSDIVVEQGQPSVYGYDAFTDIQSAVNAAPAGGTVTVAGGSYSGDVTIPVDNLTLQASGPVSINLASGYGINLDNGGPAITGFTMTGFTVNASPTTTYAFKAYKADGLTLTNDTFNGGAGNTGGGVDINTTSNVTLNNVVASGFHKNGFSFTAQYAAGDTPSSNIILNGLTATGNGWAGIVFYNTNGSGTVGADITGVVFSGPNSFTNNGQGLFVEGDSDANYLANNTPRWGILGAGGSQVDISGITFSGNGTDVVNYQKYSLNDSAASSSTGSGSGSGGTGSSTSTTSSSASQPTYVTYVSTSTGNSTGTGSTTEGSEGVAPQVAGAFTAQSNVPETNRSGSKSSKATKQSRFLGLGWYWLIPIAIILGIGGAYWTRARRSDSAA